MKIPALLTTMFFSALTAQTQQVFRCVDIFPNNGNASPSGYVVYQDKMFMSARKSGYNLELYTSNGTAAGTNMLKDLNTGVSEFSVPKEFTLCDNKLFFMAFTDATGTELWTTDGTATGTQLVKDIGPGATGCGTDLIAAFEGSQTFTVYNKKIFFMADDGVHGGELWVSDGTGAGTMMVKDINPGADPSYPLDMKVYNGKLFFMATTAGNGTELWTSDGTAAGTRMLKDINPGTESSSPVSFALYKGKLCFSADDGINGNELWVTDGTVAGTQMLKDINPGPSNSGPCHFFEYKDKLYFSSGNDTKGIELWVTDGTTAGTQLFKDINPGNDYSLPGNFVIYKDKLYFSAREPMAGTELWVTDGTVANTHMVKDLNPGSVPSNPGRFQVYKEKLYFIFTKSIFDERLAVSDGTEAGTKMIAPPGASLEDPLQSSNFLIYHDTLYFRGFFDNAFGEELWALTDTSSAAPTGIVQPVQDNTYSLYPNPGNGNFRLQMAKPVAAAATLQVYDMSGRKVHTQAIAKGTKELSIQLSHLPQGVYTTRLQTADGVATAARLVIR
ncbi:ELWxxDGT repeat protein [Taibaiella koreensis]|uniref:ELWxxDGT repeat protein n=1 Tax=Taibaiella koreensis TaxID=1268548 RepID=UPI0013C2D941|nr:ELWxxDGT repeat protein [Taibaiella koreensis]